MNRWYNEDIIKNKRTRKLMRKIRQIQQRKREYLYKIKKQKFYNKQVRILGKERFNEVFANEEFKFAA